MKALERENRELRQANEILRKASVRPYSLEPVALGPNLPRRSLSYENPGLLRQKGAVTQHRKLLGDDGGGAVRSLVLQDRGRVW